MKVKFNKDTESLMKSNTEVKLKLKKVKQKIFKGEPHQ